MQPEFISIIAGFPTVMPSQAEGPRILCQHARAAHEFISFDSPSFWWTTVVRKLTC